MKSVDGVVDVAVAHLDLDDCAIRGHKSGEEWRDGMDHTGAIILILSLKHQRHGIERSGKSDGGRSDELRWEFVGLLFGWSHGPPHRRG